MAYTLACGDVMEGCPTRFEADSKDELMNQAAAHASEAHGISEITPDIASSVEGAIRQT